MGRRVFAAGLRWGTREGLMTRLRDPQKIAPGNDLLHTDLTVAQIHEPRWLSLSSPPESLRTSGPRGTIFGKQSPRKRPSL